MTVHNPLAKVPTSVTQRLHTLGSCETENVYTNNTELKTVECTPILTADSYSVTHYVTVKY